MRTQLLRLGIAGIALMILAPMVGAVVLRLDYEGTPAPAGTRGYDALWLGHAWVDGRRGPGDVVRLAATLRGTGVRDLYVHAGPLTEDGGLDPGLRPHATEMVGALHRALPGVRVLAWLGALVGHGQLDLASQPVRDNVAAASVRVLDDGFDGVHYDFEPVRSGDTGLLAILGAVHQALARRHAVVSISAAQIEPLPGAVAPAAISPSWPMLWSAGYLRQVSQRVDQVALMAYDTALPDESLYGGYVARQTRLALQAVPAGTDLLVGVPAFHDERPGHHASAETVRAAVRGVRLGLVDDPTRKRFGVAMYVDFAATDADWRAYRDGWARPAVPR